jgi:hypothetical protein
MNLNVLLSRRSGSRTSRLVFANSPGAYARFLANRIAVIPRISIKALDRILRHILGIQEFSREPGCVLRYSRTRSRTAVALPRGELVRPGDPILELHFWNDRLSRDRKERSSPMSLRSELRRSLALLAEQLQSNENFVDIRAVHATLARIPSRSCRIRHPFGCSLSTEPRSARWRLHDCLENLLIHWLRWAFNPRHVKQKSLRLNRIELWISVSELRARFCGVARPAITSALLSEELNPSGKFPQRETDVVEAAGD